MTPKSAVYLPHTAGRYQLKRFRKVNAMKIVEQAFDIINLMTDKNPIQVLADAVANSGPREDSTRIGTSGVVRRQAVDVSPFRRVSFALSLLTTGVCVVSVV